MEEERILLVDTEKNVLLTYQNVLEEEGYKVDVATSSIEAIEKLSSHDFALLITEFNLKGKNTTTLIKHVKQHYPDIYIISLSDYHLDHFIY